MFVHWIRHGVHLLPGEISPFRNHDTFMMKLSLTQVHFPVTFGT